MPNPGTPTVRPDVTPDDCLEALRECGGNQVHAAKLCGLDRTTFRNRMDKAFDYEIVEGYVRAEKKAQKHQDVSRVERKSFREYARIENAVSDHACEIRRLLDGYEFADPPSEASETDASAAAILHLSDHHLNERVELPHNRFDWDIAGKRLRKYVDQALRHCETHGIGSALVAFTGDMLNSDRRLDELLCNAGNRAKACVLAVDLYQQVLRHLSQYLDLTVAGISGNESRITKDVGWQSEIVSDNYDFTIYEMLRMLLGDQIRFVEPTDPSRCIVKVAGQNVLLTHGHGDGGLASKADQKLIQSIVGFHQARGEKVDLVIFGHVHEAQITDGYARSSSLVGSNDYNENCLGVYGRASQNMYIVHKGGGFDGLKIDLQDTRGITGYDVRDRLKAYNTKSAGKARPKQTIMEIKV